MKIYFILFFPLVIFCIEKSPWLGNPYELTLDVEYSYSFYSKYDSANLTDTKQDHIFYIDLDCPFPNGYSFDAGLELVDTNKQDFGFRSFFIRGVRLFLDDISGDAFSLTVSSRIRAVNHKSLKDISCPNSGEVEIEGNLSIGKEISFSEFWAFRIWGSFILGIANRGSPWIDGIFAIQGNKKDLYTVSFLVKTRNGYGNRTTVNIDHFKGYGNIRESYVDLIARVGKTLGVWGEFLFEYKRRVHAKRCPKGVNTFTFIYLLPFSF